MAVEILEIQAAHYGDQNGSLYLVVRLDGRIVGGCGIAPFNSSHQTCELRKLLSLPFD